MFGFTHTGRWIIGLVLLTWIIPAASPPVPVAAGPVSSAPEPSTALSAAASPQLGELFDIWTDGVDNRTPTVAYNPPRDEYLVVWVTEQDAYTWDIWARRIGSDGSVRSWFLVDSVAGRKLEDPDVAYSPIHDGYLVTYTYEQSTSNHDIYARRINGDSAGTSARIVVDDAADEQLSPSVAYNRETDEYVIVYDDRTPPPYTQVVARRINAAGGELILGITTIASAADQYRSGPDIAYNPERNAFLVVYTFSNPAAFRCYAASKTASADLTALGPEMQLGDDTGCDHGLTVAAGPDEFLVTWHTLEQVFARRVAHDGTPRGPEGGFELPEEPPQEYRYYQDVAFAPRTGYLVTWVEFVSTSLDEANVWARYVRPGADQPWGGAFLVDNRPHHQGYPGVACARSRWCLIAEEDNPILYPGGDKEIRGRLVSPWQLYVPLAMKG